MPCTNCMAEYTRFHKEHGCSKCAYGFCEKCVSKRIIIPGLSPKPVSVCDNCYNQHAGKSDSAQLLKSRGDPSTSNKNWWGDEKLPPPSMRMQYLKEISKSEKINFGDGKAYGSSDDWKNLERRLACLVKDERKPIDNLVLNKETRLSKKDEIARLEERLAALKEVPVEVIRRPRLLVVNDDPFEDDSQSLSGEAHQLLRAVEANSSMRHCYVNSALRIDDVADSFNKSGDDFEAFPCSSPSSKRTSDSSLIRKIIKEAENAPSSTNGGDSGSEFSTIVAYTPNFADCMRETMQRVNLTEKEVEEFIRKSQEEQDNCYAVKGHSNGANQDSFQLSPPQKSVQSQNSSNSKEMANHSNAGGKESPRKKAIFFLHKFFK